MNRELKQHDQLYMKFKDLKIDYKQLLESFEKSESIRREQKEIMQGQKSDISKLKRAFRKSESKVAKMKQAQMQTQWTTADDDLNRSLMSRHSVKSMRSSRSRTPKRR